MDLLDELRRLVQWLWVSLLRMSGCLWWAKRQLRRRGAVVVLMLHRVLDDADYRRTHSLAGIVVRQRTFERLAAYIAQRCEAVGLYEAAPGAPGRKLRVAVTFDDGWRDNYTTALPIARAHHMPLTVFVCPELAGRNAPFWPERVAATLRALRPAARQTEIETIIEHLKRFTPEKREQWVESFLAQTDVQRVHVDVSDGDSTLLREEIGEMDRAGVRFGSHSNTHQILTSLPASTARREIRESQAALERELGRPCDLFAYPNGEYSLEIRQILVEQGYRLAFTTKRGAWTPECDRLAIPRSNVCERNLAGLMGKFSPSMFEYTNFWKVWRAMKADERSEVRADHRPASATVCGGAGAP